jgi:hypothetical protein
MRAGLLYSLFVIFTLLIASSELKDKKQTFEEISSCQLVDANKYTDGVLITTIYSLKEPVLGFIPLFRLTNEKLFQNIYDQKIKLSITYLRFRQFKSIGFQALIPYLRFPLLYISEKEDSHYLS